MATNITAKIVFILLITHNLYSLRDFSSYCKLVLICLRAFSSNILDYTQSKFLDLGATKAHKRKLSRKV
jgi:hypothetical protein